MTEHDNQKQHFWAITTYFNPARYRNRHKNYLKFREASRRQGLNLITVELVFDDGPFELKANDADKLIQIRGYKKNVMWQKERMLNIALQHLPTDCKWVAWLDCDILFANDSWIDDAIAKLQTHKVIQPYSVCVRLPRGVEWIDDTEAVPFHDFENGKINSFMYCRENKNEISGLDASVKKGTTGFAWAARREVLDAVGFYDGLILGGADSFMANSFIGKVPEFTVTASTEKMVEHQQAWRDKAGSEVGAESAGYTDGVIQHLWHGDQVKRSYAKRRFILIQHQFDPSKDLRIDENNLWSWIMSSKQNLRRDVAAYFDERNEDGSKLKEYANLIRRQFRGFKKDAIHVCSASDMNMIEILPTLLNSISKNTKHPVNFHLLGRGLTPDIKKSIMSLRFPRMKIFIIDMDERLQLSDIVIPKHMTISTMDRILITSLFPKIDRLIYIDMDTITIGDLAELYVMPVSELGIAAKTCVNPKFKTLDITLDQWTKEPDHIKKGVLQEKLNLQAECFNAGLMLLSLRKMRLNGFENKVMAYVEKYKVNDQIAMCMYANDAYRRLPNSWNVLVGQENPEIKNVVHWIGEKKPWSHPKVAHAEIWRKYQVPFPITKGFKPKYAKQGKLAIRVRIVKNRLTSAVPGMYRKLDYVSGQIGIRIKKISPRFYRLLRRIMFSD